ncbi:MAG: hypothetical protein FWF51_10275 [Chitinivibrionia bacterium]|nr:hypothetical protein [Chitinivibrionia bacterium]
MEKYKELDNPIDEVYRIRDSIMKEFNYDPKAYHKYLRDTQAEYEKAGYKIVTLEKTDKKPFYAQ